MNSAVATILATAIVGIGALAELHLIRMFVNDWREDQRGHARRRLCQGATRQSKDAMVSFANSRREALAATLLCGMTLSTTLAQPSSPTQPPSAMSTATDMNAITTEDRLTFEKRPALSLQPATDEPATPPLLVISTDRPSFSDGTGFVPIGHFQLETGYTFTFRNRNDVETQRHNGPEILARVPLIEDRFELRLITAGYTWSRTDEGDGAGFNSSAGWSDISLGFKLKLADQDRWLPRVALGAQTTLGVGSDNISNQITEPTLKLIWSYDLGQSFGDDWKGFTLGGNLNIAWPTAGGDRFTQGQGSVYLCFPIADRLSGFAEYYVIGPNSKGTDAAHSVDIGGAYLLNDRVQLDARAGFGINREADNLVLGIGVSFLF